jgi:hypothetical protein
MKFKLITAFCRAAFSDLAGRATWLFCLPKGEFLQFSVDPPEQKAITKKALVVVKARPESKEAGYPSGVYNEVIFMELTRPILENLYTTCQVRLI